MTGLQGSPEAWRAAAEAIPESLRVEPEASPELLAWWRRKIAEAMPTPGRPAPGSPEWYRLYVGEWPPPEGPEEAP